MSAEAEPAIMATPTISGPKKTANKAKKNKKNPVRRIIQHEVRRREASMAPASPASSSSIPQTPTPTNKKGCPKCHSTDISDGACQGCGFVLDDSNIVAEVQFSEGANGAAVAQGTRIAADQGGIRLQGRGQAFQRLPGAGTKEARERIMREAKTLLQEFAVKLDINLEVADAALALFQMAQANGFTQGRKRPNVCAICMYAACRERDKNDIMLIDLADIIKVDVFLLGRSYKELLKQIPSTKERNQPIVLEDLIFRFASKLEFLHDTHMVALSAVRIAKRMREDFIAAGRRPSGVCGAAIILAARAHNYRRTVREVVYIAKVTMATLQERMQEFANVPAAQLTIKEFQEGRLPEATHDPPVLYKQSAEWLEKHPGRKRKARAITQDNNQAAQPVADQDGSNKRQRTGSAPASASGTPAPAAVVDNDGFVVPPTPQPTQPAVGPSQPEQAPPSQKPVRDAHETAVILTGLQSAGVDVDMVDALAEEFRDDADEDDEDSEDEPEVEVSSEAAMALAQGIEIPGMKLKVKQKNSEKAAVDATEGQKKPQLVIDEAWELDERNLENEIGAHLADPAMLGAAAAVAQEARETVPQPDRQSPTPAVEVNASPNPADTPGQATEAPVPVAPVDPLLDPIVHEHEFEDDHEVMYCLLQEDDVKRKEEIWLNQNKDWMRKKQQKLFDAKMAAKGPAKAKRTRAKKPRIGEGQSTPAESAAEATRRMLETRKVSSRIDYTKMNSALFNSSRKGAESTIASTNPTAAPSVVDDIENDDIQQPVAQSSASIAQKVSAVQEETENFEEEDHDDDEAASYAGGYDPFGGEGDEEEY